MRTLFAALALLSIGCGARTTDPDVREFFPVAIEPVVDLGVRDSDALNRNYEVHQYFGYFKQADPWQVLIGMSRGHDDGLVRGNLGRVTEVLEVRNFGADSAAANAELVQLTIRAEEALGQPVTCAEFHKQASVEFRKEWSVNGKYFAVLHSRAHDDERVAVQWSTSVPPASSKVDVPCTAPASKEIQ